MAQIMMDGLIWQFYIFSTPYQDGGRMSMKAMGNKTLLRFEKKIAFSDIKPATPW